MTSRQTRTDLTDGSVDYGQPGVRDGGGLPGLRIFACTGPVIGATADPYWKNGQ